MLSLGARREDTGMASDGLDQKERHLDRTKIKPRMLSRRHVLGSGLLKLNNYSILKKQRLPAFHFPKRYNRKKIRKPAEVGLA